MTFLLPVLHRIFDEKSVSADWFPAGLSAQVATDPATGDDLVKFHQSGGEDFELVEGWKIRFPKDPVLADPTSTQPLVAMLRVVNSGGVPSGTFVLSLSALELVSNPGHVCAAELITERYTWLAEARPHGWREPVVFRGPGVALIIDLTLPLPRTFAVTSLSGQVATPFVPVLAMEPPHALVADGWIGFTCETVDLYYDGLSRPPGAPVGFRGLDIPQLGVYLHTGEPVDAWVVSARARGFQLDLFTGALSGTFAGEVVHLVPFTPQLTYDVDALEPGSGKDEHHASVTAVTVAAPTGPTGGYRYVRVRPRARLNWQSTADAKHYPYGTYHVGWTTPAAAQVEEIVGPVRDDLGWVRLPPGQHQFQALASDDRVGAALGPPLVVTVPGSAQALSVLLEAAGGGARFRSHVPLAPGQVLIVTARVLSGAQTTASATLSVQPLAGAAGSPLGIDASTPATQQTTPADRFDESAMIPTWKLVVPASAAGLAVAGVFVVTVTQGAASVARRLRYTIGPRLVPGAPLLRLEPQIDWLDGPGTAAARLVLEGGIRFEDVAWSLEWEDASVTGGDVFTDAGLDGRFAPGHAFTSGESVALVRSQETVRPSLHAGGKLWRLTATAAGAGTRVPAPLVVGEDPRAVRLGPDGAGLELRDAIAAGPPFKDAGGDDAKDAFVVFPRDVSALGVQGSGEVLPQVTHVRAGADVLAVQARGLAALVRMLDASAAGIDEIGLYGFASLEGVREHNAELSVKRAAAVGKFLQDAFANGPAQAFATVKLSPPGALPADAAFVQRATANGLDAKLATRGCETAGAASTTSVPDADDRRVVAVLRFAAQTAPAASAACYFTTLSGAPPQAYGPYVKPLPTVPHPFQHQLFRQAMAEIVIVAGRLTSGRIAVTLDLNAVKDEQLVPTTDEPPPANPQDGVVTLVFSLRRVPSGAPLVPPLLVWEAELVSDPLDVDGLGLVQPDPPATELEGPARGFAGSAIFLPAVVAVAGGRSVSALSAAAGAGVGALLAQPGIGVINPIRMILRGGRASVTTAAGRVSTVRIGVDYEVLYYVNVDITKALNLPVTVALKTEEPVRMLFRNLGMTLAAAGGPPVFDYDPSTGFSLVIEDPGLFRVGGAENPISRVLQVDRIALGQPESPVAIEADLRLGFETGLFELDGLRIRALLELARLFDGTSIKPSDISVEVSKIGVRANLPGVFSGGGSIELGNPIRGGFDLDVVPIKLHVYGGFAIYTEPDYRALYVGVGAEFFPGFPLGQSGVALRGLEGLVGVNIGRDAPDPLRTLEWYRRPQAGVIDPAKWTKRRGGFAFGAGATLGSAFDTGFVWSLKGVLVIELPGPKILLAARSRFLALEQDQPKATDNSTTAIEGGVITTLLLDFEHRFLSAQAELTLGKPKLMSGVFPADIFFDLADPAHFWLRFGQQAPAGGQLAAVRLFDLLDAWGYIQVEGQGFSWQELELAGVAVAHGARASLVFGAKPWAWCEAFLEYHVGAQLRPLFVEGVFEAGASAVFLGFSIGATATVRVKAPDPFWLYAKACGRIKTFFGRVEKCVELDLGGKTEPQLPPPELPLRRVAALDRPRRQAVDLDAVPIDGVLRLEFDKVVWAPEETSIARFGQTPRRNAVSPELAYEFDLSDVVLTNTVDSSGSRKGSALWAGFKPVTSDGMTIPQPPPLELLAWEPTLNRDELALSDGERKTITTTITEVCEAPPGPGVRAALFDGLARGAAPSWKLVAGDLLPAGVQAPVAESLGSGMPGARLADPAAVVDRPSVDYSGRRATELALRLPTVAAGAATLSVTDLVAVIAQQPADVIPWPNRDRPTDRVPPEVAVVTRAAAAAWTYGSKVSGLGLAGALSQLVLVLLPPVVAAEAVVVAPAAATGGGALWLDDGGKVVASVAGIEAAPVVAGSAASGAFSGYVARGLRHGTLSAPAGVRARVLVLAAPAAGAFLCEVRAVTEADWKAAQADGERRKTTRQVLQTEIGVFADPPTETNRPLLEPATEYRLDGTIAWRRFRDGSLSEQGTIALSGAAGAPRRSFKTSATPPRDLAPYVVRCRPSSRRVPHYTAEPIAVTFASDVIDALFARFGRRLVVRAKADRGGALLEYTANVTTRTFEPISSYEQALATAISQATCLGATGTAPKSELRLGGLEPNTPYALTIVDQETSQDGLGNDTTPRPTSAWVDGVLTDPARGALFRLDFRTSRYADFESHVAAYTATDRPVLDIVCGPPIALSAALRSIPGGTARGDAYIDAVAAALCGGPIALPQDPEIVRLWTRTLGPRPFVELAGVLLDGPEPLLRLYQDGSEQVSVTLPAGWRIVTGASGARVFFLGLRPNAPSATLAFAYRRDKAAAEEKAQLVVPLPTGPPSD